MVSPEGFKTYCRKVAQRIHYNPPELNVGAILRSFAFKLHLPGDLRRITD